MAVIDGGRQVILEPFPRINQQPVVLEDILRVLPGMETGEVVAADDEAEPVVRPAMPHEAQAIRSVVGLRQVDLEAAGHQSILTLHRQPYHGKPMGIGAQRSVFLEGVLGCHHQPHLVQP